MKTDSVMKGAFPGTPSNVPINPNSAPSAGVALARATHPLARKIVLLIAAFVIPLSAIAIFFLTQGPNKDIAFAAKEIVGDTYLRPLERLQEAVPRHQLSASDAKARAGADSDIESAFSALDSVNAEHGQALQFNAAALEKAGRSGGDPQKLRSQWNSLRQKGDAKDQATSAFYSQLLDGVASAITHAGDKSNLILDPDLDSYYLMDVTLNTMPTNSRRLADLAASVAASGVTDPAAKTQLAIYAAKLQDDLASVQSHFDTVYAEDDNFYGHSPTLVPNTKDLLQKYRDSMGKLIALLGKSEGITPAEVIQAATASRTANSELWRKSVDELDVLLKTRISWIASSRLHGLLLAALLLGIAIVVAAFVLRGITRPLAALTSTVDKVAHGDESARAPVISKDEIGQLAGAFNAMVFERAAARQKLEDENKALQNNIQQLLLAVADASDGNLAVRVRVSEGALGNVADALNLMLENVSDLIKNAKEASRQVAQSATKINESAHDLTSGSTKQAEYLAGAAADVTELSSQAHAVSEACQEATRAAEQSATAAERGAKIVRDVIHGMEKIRESVQVNAKKIKRLGERSMEIGGILRTINEISAQTDMLALNASIEAGRAGEAGRGFSAVAEQVRSLAERAKQATQQVEKLVSDIQQDTSEAVAQTEAQTQQVEAGAQKVAEAGEALNNIVQVSSASRSFVTRISSSAEQQAQRTGVMLQSVRSAADIAQSSQGKVIHTRSTSEQLATLAEKLDGQLAQFQVASLN
jgi:methyl-accepting chemotaxis protein